MSPWPHGPMAQVCVDASEGYQAWNGTASGDTMFTFCLSPSLSDSFRHVLRLSGFVQCGHLIHIKSVEGCPGQQCKMPGSGAFDFSNSCIETLPKPLAQGCHKETFPLKAIDGVTTKLKFCNLLFNTPAGLRCNEFRTYWR